MEDQPPDVETLIDEQITWCHFHGWCKDMCYKGGFKNEYLDIIRIKYVPFERKSPEIVELVNKAQDNLQVELVNKALDKLKKEDKYLLVELANKGLDEMKKEDIYRYDRLLEVGEVQDFNIDWWQALNWWQTLQQRERRSNDSEVELVNKALELVNKALDKKEGKYGKYLYDAILVDEGQDFNIDWWHTLQRVRRRKPLPVLKKSSEIKSSEIKSIEMVLVADKTQDLYNRAKYWTDESMRKLDA